MLQEAQVLAAAKALLLYLERTRDDNQLLEDESFISLVITLKKIPDKARVKPFRIPLHHSLYADRAICLITKDPQKDYKLKLEQEPIDGVEKVIGLEKLRKNYKQFKDRRELLATYDLFLADDRILPMLGALLGVKFFQKKKQPLAVNLKGNSFKADVERARDGTAFFLPAGSDCMIKIGRSSFSSSKVVENVMLAMEYIVDKIPRKWKNVQSVYLRTHDSPSLPIFASLPTVQRIDIKQHGPSRPAKTENAKKPAATPKKRKRALAEPKQKAATPAAKKPATKTKTPKKTPATSSTKKPVTKKKPQTAKKAPKTPSNKKTTTKKAAQSSRKATKAR